MSKQSSVEWFQEQIIQIVNGTCELTEIQIFEKAKAMHKEEIANAWNDGHAEGMEGGYCATYEEYYNETFGGQDNE